jgi:hypothetical protein
MESVTYKHTYGSKLKEGVTAVLLHATRGAQVYRRGVLEPNAPELHEY